MCCIAYPSHCDTSSTHLIPELTDTRRIAFSLGYNGSHSLQVASIYSNCYASDDGANVLDQLPYFEVATKLRRENEQYVEQQQQFAADLDAHKRAVADVNRKLLVRCNVCEPRATAST